MPLFEKYGSPEKVSKGIEPTKDIILREISVQKQNVSSGTHVANNKRDKSKWFRPGNRFKPIVGLYSLFGDMDIGYSNGDEISLLNELETDIINNHESIMGYIRRIDDMRSKPRKKRQKSS